MCIEVEPNAVGLRDQKAPEVICPECNGRMDFNELPDRYLLFLEE